VEFDPAVRSDIRKTRPGIIVSNNAANRSLSRTIFVPQTSNPQYAHCTCPAQYRCRSTVHMAKVALLVQN